MLLTIPTGNGPALVDLDDVAAIVPDRGRWSSIHLKSGAELTSPKEFSERLTELLRRYRSREHVVELMEAVRQEHQESQASSATQAPPTAISLSAEQLSKLAAIADGRVTDQEECAAILRATAPVLNDAYIAWCRQRSAWRNAHLAWLGVEVP